MRKTILLAAFLAVFSIASTDASAQSKQRSQATSPTTEVVQTFEVTPAYPNPFNPQTRFTVTLQEEQQVLVEVYDLLGHRVAKLHDGPLSANQAHTFTFEATDLPSGLYLIRVAGQNFVNTQRVTLLK